MNQAKNQPFERICMLPGQAFLTCTYRSTVSFFAFFDKMAGWNDKIFFYGRLSAAESPFCKRR